MVHKISIKIIRVSCLRSFFKSLLTFFKYRFVDSMNALNTHLHLVEFLCFGAMLCVLLFSLIIVSDGGL